MTSLAHRYALAVVRLRWAVFVGWVAAAAALTLSLPTLRETGGSGGLRSLAAPDNPAIQAEIRSFEEFGFPVLTRTAVVQRNPEGLTTAAQLRVVANAIEFNLERPAELRRIEFALPVINSFAPLPTRERGTTAITYLFFRPDVGFGRQTALADEYADRYAGEARDHLVGETGVVPGRVAQLRILREKLKTVEVATVVLILLVVALNFSAVGAPLVTMATAGIALTVITRVAGWIGERARVDIPSEIEPVIVALLLGIITDYSIFFLAGMRERLAAGDDRLQAARRSAAEFGPIVFVAGLTVAAGCLAVLVARVGAFRAFGPGMALTILISLVVSVTFVPACLAIFGQAVFWPRRPRRSSARRRPVRTRVLNVITRKRGAFAVVVTVGAGLLLAAAPARNLDLGFAVIESLPESHEAKRASDAAARGFLPGVLSPTVLLLEAPGITERRAALDRVQELLERRPEVAGVAGPRNQPSPINLGAVLSTSGNAARYVIVFRANPLGATAINALHELSQEMPALLAAAGIRGATASFAGDTAVAEVTVTQTEADLGLIVLVATGVGFVLLVLFLRALVAPLYLMAANVLALGASLGLTTLAFQAVGGQSGITFYVPFATAVLLVSLGSDYNIFGVGSIWAQARERPLLEAIRVAVPRSTRAISAAGVALALSFALLAVVPLSPLRQFAFAMSVGILIDVFVVRSFLVPSLVSLVGEASGWPGGALRRDPLRTRATSEPARPTESPSLTASRRVPLAVWVGAGVAIADAVRRTRRRRRRRQRRLRL
ncbi:MAG: MMPL family transporter [Actinomycetota bacterium]|nr:MMPL family transporter [Actinomycetota bacterium]